MNFILVLIYNFNIVLKYYSKHLLVSEKKIDLLETTYFYLGFCVTFIMHNRGLEKKGFPPNNWHMLLKEGEKWD